MDLLQFSGKELTNRYKPLPKSHICTLIAKYQNDTPTFKVFERDKRTLTKRTEQRNRQGNDNYKLNEPKN